MNIRIYLSILCFCVFTPLTVLASDGQSGSDVLAARSKGLGDLMDRIQTVSAVDLLKAGIGDTAADDIPYSALAHTLLMRRHTAEAAYLYSVDVDLNPDHIESYANLAATLVEMNAADPGTFPESLRNWAVANARHAAAKLPDNALIQNALSRSTLALYDETGDEDYLFEAMKAAEMAVELDDREPLLWANLARIHKKTGDEVAADAALARAKAAGPNDPGYLMAAIEFGQNPEPVAETAEPADVQPRQCNVNYNCQAQCLSGLSTGALIVSCEIEQANQQMNCEAGKEYASGYDCKADKLVFGQSSPKPEIKFCAPSFCITMQLEKNGGVTVKVQAKRSFGPVDALINVEGGYSPSNGFSFVKLSPDVKFNFLYKVPGTETAKKFGVTTSFSPGKDGKPGKLEVGAEAYSTALVGI